MAKQVTFRPLCSRLLAFSISLILAIAATNILTNIQPSIDQHLVKNSPPQLTPAIIPVEIQRVSQEKLHELSLLRKLFYNTNANESIVPDNIKNLLPYYKTQLRELITDTINRRTNLNKPPAQISAELATDLRSYGINVGDIELSYEDWETTNQLYGHINQIKIEQPANRPDLLIATTTLDLMCGEDTSLYIFKKAADKWQLIMSYESNGYDKVSGAMGNFQYSIVKNEGMKIDLLPTIVVADVNPWCISNWQMLRYKVLRVNPDSIQPTILFQHEESIYRGVPDPIFNLTSTDNKFQLEFTSYSGDPDTVTKYFRLQYELTGANVKQLTK